MLLRTCQIKERRRQYYLDATYSAKRQIGGRTFNFLLRKIAAITKLAVPIACGRFELELMLHRGVKFEIEAFSVHSLSYLSREYIPSKIHGQQN